MKLVSSVTIKPKLSLLSPDEEVKIMLNIIDQLRQVTDWSNRPYTFNGACALSDYSANAAKIFKDFIKEIDKQGTTIPWLRTALKDKEWYK